MKSDNFSKQINWFFRNKSNNENRFPALRRIGTVMFQVTEECNLRCTYCYETHKRNSFLTKDIAKLECDKILELLKKPDGILGYNNIDGLELQFIGGEPLISTDIISYIIDYLLENIFIIRKELLPFIIINISTNGYNLLSEKVQNFIKKYKKLLFLTISIDGIKELQDKNRITVDGKGSFDKVYESLCWAKQNNFDHIKATFCKDDLNYLSDSIIFFLKKGFKKIRYTGTYEDIYTYEDAKKLYNEQLKIANFILDNKILDANVSMLNEKVGKKVFNYDSAACESCGDLICFTPNGKAYPCIRFTPTSLGFETNDFCIGDYNSIFEEDKKELYNYLKIITSRSQQDDECLNCPIASGCGWCNAYCYKLYGTIEKRTKGNCKFHQARILANYYYQNKRSILFKDFPPLEISIPEEWALQIISKEEFNHLKSLYSMAKQQFEEEKDTYNLIDF